MPEIVVIIPALNEERSISKVLADIPRDIVNEVIVVDNNSSDGTAEVALNFGATVIHERRKGYGFACLKGIEYIVSQSRKADIVVFLDADYSDHPEEMTDLTRPIIQQDYDIVIGSRFLGKREPDAMPWHQVLGNRLATSLINALYKVHYTDLGPFRAIKFEKLLNLKMKEKSTAGQPRCRRKQPNKSFATSKCRLHIEPESGLPKYPELYGVLYARATASSPPC